MSVSSIRRYSEYKESGVEWLGDVPSHWHMAKVKHTAKFFGGGTPDRENEAYWMGNIPWVSPKDMKTEYIYDSEDHISDIALAESSTKLIDTGAVLIVVRSGILKHSIPVAINRVPVALNQDMKAIVPDSRLSASYFRQFVTGNQAMLLFDWRKQGATVESIEQELLSDTLIPLPPIEEQRSIADYLDRKTAEIDTLIRKKQAMIELLTEQRTAIINRAVTRGLDPDVPMKDSGIEWLGEVPEHWTLMKLAYFVNKMTNGYVGPTRDILREAGVKYIQSLHIKNNTISFEKPYFVSHDWSVEHDRTILRKDDVLVVQTGAIGEVGIVPEEFDGANCHALIILRADEQVGNGRFLLHALSSDYGKQSLLLMKTGALHPHLNTTYIRDIIIAVPPISEQLLITEYISTITIGIDNLIGKEQKSISLLQELRTSLISEVVTGAIDVRSAEMVGEGAVL